MHTHAPPTLPKFQPIIPAILIHQKMHLLF